MTTAIEALVRAVNTVTRDDDIDDMFGAELSRLLLSDITQKMEGRMPEPRQFETPTEPRLLERMTAEPVPPDRKRRAPWLVAAAALVTVLAIGAIGLIVGAQDDEVADQPAPETTIADIVVPLAPLDVAEAFMEARRAHDAAALVSLLAEGRVINDDLPREQREYEAALEYERVTGTEIVDYECREGNPGFVSCTFTLTIDWTRALGVGPFEGQSFVLRVVDGEILTGIRSVRDEFWDAGWGVFRPWMLERNAEDFAVMFDDRPVLTEESIALWERYTEEFGAEFGSG